MLLLAVTAGLWTAPTPWGVALEARLARLRPAAGLPGRGGIYDRTGEALAVSGPGGWGPARRYTVPPSLAPVLGYVHPRFGLAGLELSLDGWLAARHGGADVALTISRELHRAAESWFDGRPGAAVVLSIPEGELLALVSLPGFDPGALDQGWEHWRADADRPFFPRAVQGLYAPGSAFKVVVMAAALEAAQAGGTVGLPGPGRAPLDLALARSDNLVFRQLGVALGPQITGLARRLGLDGAPPLEIPTRAGHLPPEPLSLGEAALVGIGQGAIAFTPLQMALVAGVIASGGRALTPRLVRWMEGWLAPRVQEGPRLLPLAVAQRVQAAMALAVEEGTGTAARGEPPVAGKTGTAEVAGKPPHAWFIGFAPADRPRVAAAVVVEHGGSGGRVAAPIAAKILRAALEMMGGGG